MPAVFTHRHCPAVGNTAGRCLQNKGYKQRAIHEFSYAAGSWKRERRILTRLEFGDKGVNLRFVVSSLYGAPDRLYDQLYCQPGRLKTASRKCSLTCLALGPAARDFWPTGFG